MAGTSIPVLSLYYKSMKIRMGHGNVDSSTKLVLQINESPAGSRERRFQYEACATKSMKIQPGDGNADASTNLARQIKENPAGGRGNVESSTKLVLQIIPVPSLYYKAMTIQPGRGSIDSSTKPVLQINEHPAGSREHRFQYSLALQINEHPAGRGNVHSSTKLVLQINEIPAGNVDSSTKLVLQSLYYKS